MRKITKQSILKDLPNKWKYQYSKPRDLFGGKNSEDIFKKLAETELTEQSAKEIIGNDSWTENKCNECGLDVETTIQLAGNDEYDPCYCLECLNKAICLLKV